LTRLAAAAAAGAQSLVNYRIQLVDNQLTNQLNKKIAALQAEAQDPEVPRLQQQAAQLSQQQSAYTAAQAIYSQNGTLLADLSLRLGDLAIAAQKADSAGFDQNLGAITTDVSMLQVAQFRPQLAPDGVVNLKVNGIGVQSSATYNLATPAGQAQASHDIQAAQTVVQGVEAVTTSNQLISGSIIDALNSQISAINDQVDQRQTNVLTDDATKVANLKQQEQEQFHVIELAFSDVGEAANMMLNYQSSTNIAPPAGSIISVLVGASDPPSLAVGNLAPATAPVAVPVAGSTVSTTA
jgi:hypothetical protein